MSAEDVRKAQNAFFAFSIGPRNCVGRHLAYMELSLVIARIVWLFEMEAVENKISVEWLEEMRLDGSLPTVDKLSSHPAHGPFFRFRVRERN